MGKKLTNVDLIMSELKIGIKTVYHENKLLKHENVLLKAALKEIDAIVKKKIG